MVCIRRRIEVDNWDNLRSEPDPVGDWVFIDDHQRAMFDQKVESYKDGWNEAMDTIFAAIECLRIEETDGE